MRSFWRWHGCSTVHCVNVPVREMQMCIELYDTYSQRPTFSSGISASVDLCNGLSLRDVEAVSTISLVEQPTFAFISPRFMLAVLVGFKPLDNCIRSCSSKRNLLKWMSCQDLQLGTMSVPSVSSTKETLELPPTLSLQHQPMQKTQRLDLSFEDCRVQPRLEPRHMT
jgi:hypothetical protein